MGWCPWLGDHAHQASSCQLHNCTRFKAWGLASGDLYPRALRSVVQPPVAMTKPCSCTPVHCCNRAQLMLLGGRVIM